VLNKLRNCAMATFGKILDLSFMIIDAMSTSSLAYDPELSKKCLCPK
jgi:hypothetical protein